MKTLLDRYFVDSYIMVNFDITFEGIKSWFSMSGLIIDDATLFRSLLLPEQLYPDIQSEFMRMIVYRNEDVFFQANRLGISEEEDRFSDVLEPVHQLLLKIMNIRTLRGEQEALLDLYVLLQEDKTLSEPLYPSLHGLFSQKWSDGHESA